MTSITPAPASFGHCDVCVAHTVQPYRRAVPPASCHTCLAFAAGIEQGRIEASIDVSGMDWPKSKQTLGVMKFWSAAVIAARGKGAPSE